MIRLHTQIPGLLVAIILAGIAYPQFLPHPEPSSKSYHGHASHGLRIYIDPNTGEYARPPEPTVKITQEVFSARAFLNRPTTTTPMPPRERASPKSDGGYTIELHERFRSSRKDS